MTKGMTSDAGQELDVDMWSLKGGLCWQWNLQVDQKPALLWSIPGPPWVPFWFPRQLIHPVTDFGGGLMYLSEASAFSQSVSKELPCIGCPMDLSCLRQMKWIWSGQSSGFPCHFSWWALAVWHPSFVLLWTQLGSSQQVRHLPNYA